MEMVDIMEDALSFSEVLAVLHRRFWIVVLVVAVAVGIAVVLSYMVLPPIYQSDTSLIVNEKQNLSQSSGGIDYSQIQTNRSLAITYAKIITSRTVLQDTITTLTLPKTVKQLMKMTNVEVEGTTEIISVTVRDTDAARAALVANTIASSFISQLPALVNRVESVSIIDPAVPVADQVSPRPVLNMAVGLLAGLVSGVLFAFLVDYFDDTVKTSDDIKKLFGLRVLAVIPEMSAKDVPHGHVS